jgi:hypothetical protein
LVGIVFYAVASRRITNSYNDADAGKRSLRGLRSMNICTNVIGMLCFPWVLWIGMIVVLARLGSRLKYHSTYWNRAKLWAVLFIFFEIGSWVAFGVLLATRPPSGQDGDEYSNSNGSSNGYDYGGGSSSNSNGNNNSSTPASTSYNSTVNGYTTSTYITYVPPGDNSSLPNAYDGCDSYQTVCHQQTPTTLPSLTSSVIAMLTSSTRAAIAETNGTTSALQSTTSLVVETTGSRLCVRAWVVVSRMCDDVFLDV